MPYKATLQLTHPDVKLLITDHTGNDRLKAVLPAHSRHPRALLTLLEGIALWTGQPLCTVIDVDAHVRPSLGEGLFGAGPWPDEGPLVQFEFIDRGPRRKIRGPGDFRQLYMLHGRAR